MIQAPVPTEPLLPDQEEKLRELTTQSWNLELVISGAALFAVLQLPELLDEAFDYVHYNLLTQTAGMQGLFPSMAYSMMKAICYVLFLAFLTNFVMRGFWVGLVYIAYPKALDTLLTRLVPEPVWNDTLSRAEKRRQFAEWSNQQINRLLHIRINDSLYRNPDLLFTLRDENQQRGWQTILLPTNLKLGRNTLSVKIQTDSTIRGEEIVSIPFCYVPEK